MAGCSTVVLSPRQGAIAFLAVVVCVCLSSLLFGDWAWAFGYASLWPCARLGCLPVAAYCLFAMLPFVWRAVCFVLRWLLSFFFVFGFLGAQARQGRPEAENRKGLKGGAQAQNLRAATQEFES